MSTHTPQQIKEAFARLPQPLKEAIDSEETDNVIFALRKKLGLTIEQLGGLSEEVGAVFLGFTRASDFPREVKERLSLDQAKTDEIVRTVNDQIFAKIRVHLQAQTPAPSSNTPVRPPSNVTMQQSNNIPSGLPPNNVTMQQSNNVPPPAVPSMPPKQMPPDPSLAPSNAAMKHAGPDLPAAGILEQKLAAPFTVPAKEGVNGNTAPVSQVPKIDPYRESVE